MAVSSLITLFSVMLLAATVYSQDSTVFSYTTFTPNSAGLTYQGDAHIQQGSSYVSLIRTRVNGTRFIPLSWSAGRVLFSTPVQFSEIATSRQASFETTVGFIISPSQNGAADGLAFFIAPVGSTIPLGATGGNLGVFPLLGAANPLFAVEFDTYANPWDPSFAHVGIDINSRVSRATASFQNARGLVTARISYDAVAKRISVVADNGPQNYAVSYDFDLKTVLPERVQVGISGSTGQDINGSLGLQDILFWSFNSTLVNDI